MIYLYEKIHSNNSGNYGSAWTPDYPRRYFPMTLWQDDFGSFIRLMGMQIKTNVLNSVLFKRNTNKSDFKTIMKNLDLNILRAFYAYVNGKYYNLISEDNHYLDNHIDFIHSTKYPPST